MFAVSNCLFHVYGLQFQRFIIFTQLHLVFFYCLIYVSPKYFLQQE